MRNVETNYGPCDCCGTPCGCCGDPWNLRKIITVSSCPTYDGLEIPITWDPVACQASGFIDLGAVCAGCSRVSALIRCIAGVFAMSIAIEAGPPADECAKSEPGPGCTPSVTTSQCTPCLIVTSRTCFGDVGNCCSGFYVDAVATTCA